jgi:hypothetical protein
MKNEKISSAFFDILPCILESGYPHSDDEFSIHHLCTPYFERLIGLIRILLKRYREITSLTLLYNLKVEKKIIGWFIFWRKMFPSCITIMRKW